MLTPPIPANRSSRRSDRTNAPPRWLAGIVLVAWALLFTGPAARAQPIVWWQAQLGGMDVDNIAALTAGGDCVYHQCAAARR